jgi:riboflavin synthase
MFTGIIEHLGTIEILDVRPEGKDAGGRISIHAPTLAPKLTVSQSVAVNGCCLTVVTVSTKSFSADLSGETIRKTSFGANPRLLKPGSPVNLEAALTAGKEFGGHIVQGHVDTTGRVTNLVREGESWWLGVEVPEDFTRYVVPQGSITIDGISLTVARWKDRIAHIAIIPYTYTNTNLSARKPGDPVNLEADVLGKYIEQHLAARNNSQQQPQLAPKPEQKPESPPELQSQPQLTIQELIEQGW